MNRTPLRRKTPMRRGGKRETEREMHKTWKDFPKFIDKPRKPLRKQSPKRKARNTEYAAAVKQWRASHDGRCEMRRYYIQGPPRGTTLERMRDDLNDGYYYAGTRDGTNSRCSNAADPAPHHMALRGPNLCNIATFLGVCRTHHDWIHSHTREARRLGYILDLITHHD